MALKRRIASLSVGLLLCGAMLGTSPATAAAGPGGQTGCSDQFLAGDNRLGPQQLPTAGEIAPMVRGYDPLAGLTAQQFITTYWDPIRPGWRYPPDNGFLIAGGRPIEYSIRLGTGQDIDRFGSEFGAFLAPEGTTYAQRALPPMSLDNFDPAFPCNFHEYRVTKSFLVDSGPIAPGFGQPGLGRQYELNASLVPGAPANLNVKWLIDNGYLQRVD